MRRWVLFSHSTVAFKLTLYFTGEGLCKEVCIKFLKPCGVFLDVFKQTSCGQNFLCSLNIREKLYHKSGAYASFSES